jgi:hypothetical protein
MSQDLQNANEPILQESKERFVLFPIEHERIWKLTYSRICMTGNIN